MAMNAKGGKRLFFIVMCALVVLAAAWFVRTKASANTAAPPKETASAAAESAAIDIDAAMADRVLGDPKAPVRIDEYASLTCSHCSHFSKTTFDALKEQYIDTGKVMFVYHDFPLNAPALEAAMVARCLPADKYFQFIKFLFETQEQWAFGKDYSASLKQNSKLLGLSEEKYDSCVSNEMLKARLVTVMQKASDDLEIASTPTFIFNGDPKARISGALPLDAFKKVIDPLLEAHQ